LSEGSRQRLPFLRARHSQSGCRSANEFVYSGQENDEFLVIPVLKQRVRPM